MCGVDKCIHTLMTRAASKRSRLDDVTALNALTFRARIQTFDLVTLLLQTVCFLLRRSEIIIDKIILFVKAFLNQKCEHIPDSDKNKKTAQNKTLLFCEIACQF